MDDFTKLIVKELTEDYEITSAAAELAVSRHSDLVDEEREQNLDVLAVSFRIAEVEDLDYRDDDGEDDDEDEDDELDDLYEDDDD